MFFYYIKNFAEIFVELIFVEINLTELIFAEINLPKPYRNEFAET